MSTLDDDLGLVANGELSRDELVSAHGAGVEQLLDLHEHLSQLSTVEIEPPPWYAVGPQLGAEPAPVRRRKRSVVAGIAAALVLIPATAEGIEAIAPDAVEGTIIDRITDVFPWDEDTPIPATDRPTDRETDAPAVTDGSDEPGRDVEQPPAVDRIVKTDQTTTTVPDRENFVDRLPDRDRPRDELLPDRRREPDRSDLTPEERERLRERTEKVDESTTTVRDAPATTAGGRGAVEERHADTAPLTSSATTTTAARDGAGGALDRRGG